VMVCPCHASEFNIDGSVKQGPAAQPLRRYSAALNPGGKLVITL
jgi:Rieske Fe-S protein